MNYVDQVILFDEILTLFVYYGLITLAYTSVGVHFQWSFGLQRIWSQTHIDWKQMKYTPATSYQNSQSDWRESGRTDLRTLEMNIKRALTFT